MAAAPTAAAPIAAAPMAAYPTSEGHVDAPHRDLGLLDRSRARVAAELPHQPERPEDDERRRAGHPSTRRRRRQRTLARADRHATVEGIAGLDREGRPEPLVRNGRAPGDRERVRGADRLGT